MRICGEARIASRRKPGVVIGLQDGGPGGPAVGALAHEELAAANHAATYGVNVPRRVEADGVERYSARDIT